MPTAPVAEAARTGRPSASKARARPLTQSITARVETASSRSPIVGQPSEPAEPMPSPRITP